MTVYAPYGIIPLKQALMNIDIPTFKPSNRNMNDKTKLGRQEFFGNSEINETQTSGEDLIIKLTESLTKVLQTDMSPNRKFYTHRCSRLIEQVREKIAVFVLDHQELEWRESMKVINRMVERQELLDVMKYRECKQDWQNQLMDSRNLIEIVRFQLTGGLQKLMQQQGMKPLTNVDAWFGVKPTEAKKETE